MRVLFVGVGLTDYINQLLNKLDKEAALEIYNLIDANGVGHIPSGTHQSREGILYKIVSLPGVVKNKYNNNSYWSFVNLAKTLSDIRPDIIITTPRYIHTFLYDKQIASKIKEIRTKLILRDNPFLLERYDKRKEKILAGKIDDQYIPFYVFYFVRLLQLLGFKNSEVITQKTMQMLRLTRLCSRARSRGVLLARLEEKKHILNVVDANASYIEEAYELYGSYGVPREKIFILYNSPDTDILFAIREKIEHEPPILRYNPHRIIHVGRLVTQKRVDMLIDAVAEFQKDFSDTELLVVGYGPEDSALRALARESGVEGRVRFVGGVYDQALLGKYFLASAVYVLAGMGGLSINDAMAFGRPIVCSVCDGTEKQLVYEGENGMYFKNGDGKDLTDKLRYLFKNPELVKKMGEHSTDIIKNKINIHTVIKGYLDAFTYVMS